MGRVKKEHTLANYYTLHHLWYTGMLCWCGCMQHAEGFQINSPFIIPIKLSVRFALQFPHRKGNFVKFGTRTCSDRRLESEHFSGHFPPNGSF